MPLTATTLLDAATLLDADGIYTAAPPPVPSPPPSSGPTGGTTHERRRPVPIGPVTVRHIKMVDAATINPLGNFTMIGRAMFLPQDRRAINGGDGFAEGSYSRVRGDQQEPGDFTLTFPNAIGEDGVLHERRFLIRTDPEYEPGEEFVEIYHGDPPRLVYVGTPTSCTATETAITLSGSEPPFVLKKTRGSEVDIWDHAPRDVFAHYAQVEQLLAGERFSFNNGQLPAGWTSRSQQPDRVIATSSGVQMIHTTTSTTSTLLGAPVLNIGGADNLTDWQADFVLRTITMDDPVGYVRVGFREETGLPWSELSMGFFGGTETRVDLVAASNGTGGFTVSKRGSRLATKLSAHRIRLVKRGRWLTYFLDGSNIGVFDIIGTPTHALRPFVDVVRSQHYVTEFVLTQLAPMFRDPTDPGDYHLPGDPGAASGGLRGQYWSEASSLVEVDNNVTAWLRSVPEPARDPTTERFDTTIDFQSTTWTPAGISGTTAFSARWTGSIYLDLAAADWSVRLRNLTGAGRVYIGRTRVGEHTLESWQGGVGRDVIGASLRASLGSTTGWYPIVVEYAIGGGANAILTLEWRQGTGAFGVVPSSMLSPYGVHSEQLRRESHDAGLAQVVQTHGYEWRFDPYPMEDPRFPGTIVPRVRVGHDVDVVIEPDNSANYQSTVDATESVSSMIADAAGVGGEEQDQITAQTTDVDRLTRRALVSTEYESLADISQLPLLQTRLDSLLRLRATSWQEVGLIPTEGEGLVADDQFVLTGEAARFDWLPGDAPTRSLPTIGVQDVTPVPILSVQWDVHPAGRGRPAVVFQSRPRDARRVLARIQRVALTTTRYNEARLAYSHGNLASVLPTSGVPASTSIAALPDAYAQIIDAYVVVFSGASVAAPADILVNGVNTNIHVTQNIRHRIAGFLGPSVATGVSSSLVVPASSSVSIVFQTELVVAVR